MERKYWVGVGVFGGALLATKLSIVIYPKGCICNISASNNAEVKTSKLNRSIFLALKDTDTCDSHSDASLEPV